MKFEILQEIPKCDTDTQSEQILLENGMDRLVPDRLLHNLNL